MARPAWASLAPFSPSLGVGIKETTRQNFGQVPSWVIPTNYLPEVPWVGLGDGLEFTTFVVY